MLMMLTLFYSEFFYIFLSFSTCSFVSVLFFLLSWPFVSFLSFRLVTYNPNSEKVSAYECGFDPYEDARNSFDVRFYLIAILFILFDLEAAFFFPWSVSLSLISFEEFFGMLDFLVELLLGVFYAWVVGSLDWEQILNIHYERKV